EMIMTETPYYAVIFTSMLNPDIDGYSEMAEKMETLARLQDGFLGIESARADIGITVSYWKNLEAISQWKQNVDHLQAQAKGRADWYDWYRVRVCRVERDYEFGS